MSEDTMYDPDDLAEIGSVQDAEDLFDPGNFSGSTENLEKPSVHELCLTLNSLS